METVRVDLKDRSYQILIGAGFLKEPKKFLDDNEEKNFVIMDRNVEALYGNYFDNLRSYTKIVVEPGEQSKSFAVAERILQLMLDAGATRKATVVALGGGVIGDLAGFCSSIYMRGIPFIQVPTTLLAQVDSSVGGKTGINFGQFKNSIGSFYQPEKVLIDLDFLHTLPQKERVSGLGEVIKYGIIYDYNFLQYIMENIEQIKACNPKIMLRIIKRSLEIKAAIVAKDERESGLRRLLNFGHTLGHALEGVTGFAKYTHGEAVIIGMYYETLMAERMGIIDGKYASELLNFFRKLDVDPDISHYPGERLVEWMQKDKKNPVGRIAFILPVTGGKTEEYLLGKAETLEILAKLVNYHSKG